MKITEKELIKTIRKEKKVTAKVLAGKLGVSLRSIKNYVQSINKQFPGAIISSSKGYSINSEIVQKMLHEQPDFIPQTAKERIVYLEKRLLGQDQKGSLNVFDLCEEIFVSYSTLKKDLQAVKREMREYDLTLLSKGDEIETSGSEKNKRKMLSAIIYKESGVNFVSQQAIQQLFPDIDIPYIKATVIDVFDQAKYFTNDYCLSNLILHIAIAIDRIQRGNTNSVEPSGPMMTGTQEYAMAHAIAKNLETEFHIQYSEAEIHYMVLLILSRATSINYVDLTVSNLQSVIGNKNMEIVERITDELSETYYIDLKDPDFLTRFALHIKNLAIRSQNNHYTKNPFTHEIQTTCPLIYDMALHTSLMLENTLNITINEDETAYLALHLGSALEEQNSMRFKTTAVLYCPNYYNMSLKLADKINRTFSDRLLIQRVITDETEIAFLKEIDMVISTIPLTETIPIPVTVLPYFYTAKDEQRLSQFIGELERKKRQMKFKNYLRQLVLPDFFEITNDLLTRDGAIVRMVERLTQSGYVKPDFEKEILERETLSATAFGDFAIPHSMKMNALKTGICVLISKHPIDWSGHSVQLILMMCFNRDERRIFNEIYEPLTITLSDPENVQKIISCQAYEEFIDQVVWLL